VSTRVTVVAAGMATTVQDLGRPGHAHLGVTRSGAVDPGLMGMLNRVLGNDPGLAVLETVGGLVLEADDAVVVATSAHGAPFVLRRGDRVTVPSGGGRQWHYLAVRGGFDFPIVLGSRSHDTMSGLGAVALSAGTSLPVGDEPSGPIGDVVPVGELSDTARVEPGPRLDWFEAGTITRWRDRRCTVTATSRVGVRLSGLDVRRVVGGELPSEGLVRGAVQVPPDGDPIMMLADHPTTGGYPVVAVVHPDDVAVVAQHPVGGSVRLVAG
jgi:biotin-dependent carboxylase-like uncharacterized protein